MKQANSIKTVFTALFSVLTSLLGVLAIPVILMVLCNIIDYATGLMASPFRKEDINSYKSMKGICKKVCMWLLVVVGAIIDQLLLYASDTLGIALPFTFLVACIVAIWIICNELISILENVQDMGVTIPAFLQPIVKNIKTQVEHEIAVNDNEENGK
ncbi:MAG: phage holin family protein [Hespellia sp.]|nr:phage holin family protein [Hespellia sp.]